MIRLHALTLDAFKATTRPTTYDLNSDQVTISGDNATGKSTIRDAILWVLYGTNLTGSNRVEGYLPQGAAPVLSASLTLTAKDGAIHTIRRHRAKTTTLTDDDMPASQAEIEALVGPRDRFLLTFQPETFLNFTEGEARSLLMSLLPPVDQDLIFLGCQGQADVLRDRPATYFRDLDKTLKMLRQKNKKDHEQLLGYRGALDSAVQHPVLAPTPVEPPDRSPLDAAMTALHQASATAHNTAALEQTQKTLQQLKSQAAAHTKTGPQIDHTTQQQLTTLEQQWRQTEQRVMQQEAQWAAREPQSPITGGTCPTCGQAIAADHAQHAQDAYRQALAQWRQAEQAIVTQKETLAAQKAAWTQAQTTAIETAAMTHRVEQLRWKQRITETEELLATYQRQQEAPQDYTPLKNAVTAAQQDFQTQSSAFAQYQAQQKQYDQWLQTTAQYQTLIDQATESLTVNEAEIAATMVYRRTQMTMQTAPLLEQLKETECVLWTMPSDPEQDPQPTFKILYHQRPIAQCSTAERVAAAIEWHNAFNALGQDSRPLFLDNAESITHIPAITGQALIARVVPQLPLTVKAGQHAAA